MNYELYFPNRLENHEIYRKPTNSDRYLNFYSCRPVSVKRGAAISQADRDFRICSQNCWIWNYCI
jgi:hypothetical protein